jgi:hypothetical protein
MGFMVAQAFQSIPYTLDFSTWYASHAFGVILSFMALAGWGFYISLGGPMEQRVTRIVLHSIISGFRVPRC